MFGGNDFKYPSSHKLGMQIPRNGSMCGNCKFLGADHKTCKQPEWVKWNGSNVLPVPDEQYCCDLYMPARILKAPKKDEE